MPILNDPMRIRCMGCNKLIMTYVYTALCKECKKNRYKINPLIEKMHGTSVSGGMVIEKK